VSTLSVALALAGLADPPDLAPVLEERDRLAAGLRELGLEPLPSAANFLYVPVPDAPDVAEALLSRGLLVRPFPDALRITIRDAVDDDRLLTALQALVAR
jgi:histidinol-phosphate aminotransferase